MSPKIKFVDVRKKIWNPQKENSSRIHIITHSLFLRNSLEKILLLNSVLMSHCYIPLEYEDSLVSYVSGCMKRKIMSRRNPQIYSSGKRLLEYMHAWFKFDRAQRRLNKP